MKIAHIFVDEYGDPNLDTSKNGTTPFFVYTAVVILQDNISTARTLHNSIIQSYFSQRGYIKSNKIPNNDRGYNLQVNVLNTLKDFPHFVVSIVVDKKEIDKTGGLLFKPSFVKFFQQILANELLGKYDEYHIYMDNMGRPKFQAQIIRYMSKIGVEHNLFANNSFEFKDDVSEEPLIQLADFYSGCIGRHLCDKFSPTQADYIYNIIKSYTFVKWFPFENISYIGSKYINDDKFNDDIYKIAISTAISYMDESDEDSIAREIVSILLQESHINPIRCVSSGEINRKVKSKGLKISDSISEVSKLRDKGVFIISPSGKKGYKFPCNEKEIAEYFDRISTNVIPQLKRAHRLHRILVEQSGGAHNVLRDGTFDTLKNLIVVVNNASLTQE